MIPPSPQKAGMIPASLTFKERGGGLAGTYSGHEGENIYIYEEVS